MAKKKTGHGGAREGAGRKPVFDDPVTITLTMPSALLNRVERHAEQLSKEFGINVSRNVAAVKLLEKGLEK